jgi:hypothetical protein
MGRPTIGITIRTIMEADRALAGTSVEYAEAIARAGGERKPDAHRRAIANDGAKAGSPAGLPRRLPAAHSPTLVNLTP